MTLLLLMITIIKYIYFFHSSWRMSVYENIKIEQKVSAYFLSLLSDNINVSHKNNLVQRELIFRLYFMTSV